MYTKYHLLPLASVSLSGPADFIIGYPNLFLTGPHEGRTIRMELHEIQKADLGCRYAKFNRKPLDPPPVILLKMFEVHNVGTDREHENELAYDDTQLLGLVCTIDLFPVPGPDILPSKPSPSPSPSFSGYYNHQQQQSNPGGLGPFPNRSFTNPNYPPKGITNIVHHFDRVPISESSKQTQALVGATFVQPLIFEYQGNKAIAFAFADLAVKIEGSFILRYRIFDIFAGPRTQQLTITAEVYGGIFRVYSPKEFPGLAASTELTKTLARWGMRLNIREVECTRDRRPAPEEKDLEESHS